MMQKPLRVYVDTSVVSAPFDTNGQDRQTRPFWDAVKSGKIRVIVSDITETELQNARQRKPHVWDFYLTLPESQIDRVVSTEQSDFLAAQHVAEGVVGEKWMDDCKHIAIAAVCHADCLVSWNFKHIVNVQRVRGYNSVNVKHNYPILDIRTPYEVINDE